MRSHRGVLSFIPLLSLLTVLPRSLDAQVPLPVETRVTSNQPETDDLFGSSVAVSGDHFMVGAPYDDDQATNAGVVYIFKRTDGWLLRQKLFASDGSVNGRFGTAVDSFVNTLVVGAPGKDAVYVFDWNGGTNWIQIAKLTPPDGLAGSTFGIAVAVHRNTIVVGSMVGAYLYVWNGNAWVFQQKLPAGGSGISYAGSSVAIYENTLVLGAYGAESASIYTRSNNVWSQADTVVSPDQPAEQQRFGWSVAVYGDTVVVGTAQNPFSSTGYTPGRAFVYKRVGAIWVLSQTLTASDGTNGDQFGQAVSIWADRIVVGAVSAKSTGFNYGGAYVFDWNGSTYVQVRKPIPANVNSLFGFAVDNNGDQVGVGAPYSAVGQVSTAGAAYVFERLDPLGWASVDIGNVALTGSVTNNKGVFQLTGSGADIWGSADEFFYVYQMVSGDFEIIGRVTFLQNTDPWAKVGLMARDAFGPGERNALVFVTPFNGAGLQWRSAIGGQTQFTPGGPASFPVWLRLVRTGNTLSAYKSFNGSDWTFIGSTTLNLQATISIGLALTSHRDGVGAQATVDNVSVIRPNAPVPAAPSGLTATAVSSSGIQLSWTDNSTNEDSFEIQRSTNGVDFVWIANGGVNSFGDTIGITSGTRYWYRVRAVNNSGVSAWSNIADATTPLAGGSLPSPWQTEDVATSGGAASFANGVFTVSGDGADIWEITDRFRFVYQPREGDVTITARVDSQTFTHGWAKAGLMMRETISAGARNAFVFVTPDHGVGFQWRIGSSGQTQYVPGPANLDAPIWLRLVRSGDNVAGYWSPDGNNWQLIGSVTLTFAHSFLTGMAVTSHQQGVLSTVNFSNLNVIGGGSPGGALPAPWQNQDIGPIGVAGNASFSSGTFTIAGDGRDIWETTDAFHFVYQPWNGDAELIAEVTSFQNTDPWAKVGIMFRQSLAANSPYVMMMLTAGHGSGFQARATTGATSTYAAGPNPTSGWIALVRQGNVFNGFISSDGINWTWAGSQSVSMTGTIYVGLAVTSHNNAVLNTSTVRNVQLSLP